MSSAATHGRTPVCGPLQRDGMRRPASLAQCQACLTCKRVTSSRAQKGRLAMTKRSTAAMTVGLDLGDRVSSACVLDTRSGEELEQWRVRTTRAALARRFEGQPAMRVALEVGSQSPWVSRLLASWGHEVL